MMLPDFLPENPAVVYRDCGWSGWAHLLATEGGGVIDENDLRTVYLALIPALEDEIVRIADMKTLVHDQHDRVNSNDRATRRWHKRVLTATLRAIKSNENNWWERDLIKRTLVKLK